MEETIALVFWIGIGVVVVAVFWSKRTRRQREEADRQRRLMEKKRIEECAEVVLFFHNYLGYIAKQLIDRTELEFLIDEGMTADELATEIGSRIAEKDGIVLGYQPLGGIQVDVKLTLPLRERHIYIIGKSGSGKTNLIRNLIFQDIERGEGVGVIAPEQEMIVDEILPYIPDHRIDDVIYFNPADTDYPVCFNPLHLDEGEDIDLRADEAFTIFQRLMGEGSGPRMNEILRQTLYALLERPRTTLLDIERLLDPNNSTLRDAVIRESNDPDRGLFNKRATRRNISDKRLLYFRIIGSASSRKCRVLM